MERKSVTKNALYSFLKSFMSLIFPLITFPYASRILQPYGIGKINFASSVINYFTMIATLGITSYGIREAARLRDNKHELSKFTKEILSINALSTMVSFSLVLLSLFAVPKFKDYTSLFFIYSIPLLLTMFSMDWFFNALEEFRYITIRSVFFQFSSLIILFLFVKNQDDLEWYAITGIFGVSCSAICNFFYSHKFINYKEKCKLELKKHIKPILTFFGMSVVSSFYCVLDSTMLGFLSNETQVGFYSSATKMNKVIISLITSLLAVLLPRLSFFIQNNDKKSFNSLTQKSFSLILILSIPIATGLYILAEPCILILSGSSYLPSITPMRIMIPLFIILTTATLTGCQILPAINKEKIGLYSYIIGAISNFTLNLILIPKYGCIGAAIATVCAESAVTLFQLFFTWKYLFCKDNLLIFIQVLISTAVMGFLVFILSLKIENYVLEFIVCTIFGALVYFIFLCITQNKYALIALKKLFTINSKANNSEAAVNLTVNQDRTITVLMATYNGETFVREQIDSILNQTYRNIKLIINDDNSTDSTYEILKDYAAKYKNISIYKNEVNLGFKKNFEKLVNLADTELIAFTDQDDIWEDNKLELCMQHIDANSIVCTNSKLIDTKGKDLNYTMMNVIIANYIPDDNEILFKHLFHTNFVQGSTILTKRSFLLKHLPIPEEFVYHDWWFAFFAALDQGIHYVTDCTLRYRQHNNQVTCNKRGTFLSEFFRLVYKNNLEHYKERIAYCQYFIDNETLSEDHRNFVIRTKDYFESMINKKNSDSINYYKEYYDIIFFDTNKIKKHLRLLKRRLGIIKSKLIEK